MLGQKVAKWFSHPILVILPICLLVSLFNYWNFDLINAISGYSAHDWINKLFNPSNFSRDFPSIIDDYKASLAMYPYKWMWQYFHMPVDFTLPVYMFFEVLALSLALWHLCGILIPKCNWMVRTLVILLTLSGYARDVNLARFHQPTIWGLYYNFADAFRLAGVSFFLRRRAWMGAFFLALTFMCHPVLGLISGIFVGSLFLFSRKDLPWQTWIGSFGLFAVLSLGWIFLTGTAAQVGTSKIPIDMWFQITEMTNYHWYPFSFGLLTTDAHERLLPFLCLLLLSMAYFLGKQPLSDIDQKVLRGSAILLAITGLGVIISVLKPSPMLIKMALHRSNDLVAFMALPYFAQFIFQVFQTSNFFFKTLATLVTCTCFAFFPGYSIPLTVLLASDKLWTTGRGYLKNIFILILTTTILLPVIYKFAGIRVSWSSSTYQLPLWFVITGLIGLVCFFVFRKNKIWTNMLIGAAILVAFGFSLWQLQQERLWPEENRKMAQDYKDVQLWASEHTDPQALFLPEPVTFYAWRGYANRSSAGNLREWISVGWYYNSNYDSYIEGQKRYEEFGFQTKNYFGRSPPIQGFIDLTNDFEKKFYSLSDNDFLNFAGKYKIDYMVLRKPKLGRKTELPVAYENENYLLVKTASTKAEK